MDDPLALEGFRRWLQSMPPGAIVGEPGCPHLCPIAEYLKSLGWVNVDVDGLLATGQHAGEYKSLRTPEWVEIFTERVDAYPTSRITAALALALLAEVAAEVAA